MSRVTVVAEEKTIIVDGDLRTVDMEYPTNLRAIQLDGTTGEAEWSDGTNTEISDTDVAVYVTAWANVAAPAMPDDGGDYYWNAMQEEWIEVAI
tara:strand:- start:73 stop:354 length:282 start_codon:yes stop_codon:yes gene_type:complete